MEGDIRLRSRQRYSSTLVQKPDALPLDIFGTPDGSNEIIECKDQRPVGERAESDRVIDVVHHAGKGSSESPVVFVPIPPDLQGAEGEHFLLAWPIWNPVNPKVYRCDTAAVARGNIDLLSKQSRVKLLAGFGCLFIFCERIPWGDVWVGAIFTTILFTIGKTLIGIYIGKSTISSAYGVAGSLIVLLLWIYYSAQIFLFGAEFTCAFAYARGSRRTIKVPNEIKANPDRPSPAKKSQ